MSCKSNDICVFLKIVPALKMRGKIIKYQGGVYCMSKEKTAQLHKSVRPYTFADNKKSIIQILNTILPLFIFWALAYVSVSYSILLALFFAIIASGLIIRTFIIFHDCTHC